MNFRQIIPAAIDRVHSKDRSTSPNQAQITIPFQSSVPPPCRSSPTVERPEVISTSSAPSTLPYLLNHSRSSHSYQHGHSFHHRSTSHVDTLLCERSPLPPISFHAMTNLETFSDTQPTAIHYYGADKGITADRFPPVLNGRPFPSHLLASGKIPEQDSHALPDLTATMRNASNNSAPNSMKLHLANHSFGEMTDLPPTHVTVSNIPTMTGAIQVHKKECEKPIFIGDKSRVSDMVNNVQLGRDVTKTPPRKRAISDLQNESFQGSLSIPNSAENTLVNLPCDNSKVTGAMTASPPPQKRMAIDKNDVAFYKDCPSSAPEFGVVRSGDSDGDVSSLEIQAARNMDRSKSASMNDLSRDQRFIGNTTNMRPLPILANDPDNEKTKMGNEKKTEFREGTAVNRSTPFTCAQCADRFETVEERQLHIKNVHTKKFGCSICLSRFARKYDLKKHTQIVHAKVRPFTCEICEHSFGQKHHLVRHKRALHMKERLFACSMCSSRFSREEHLQNHSRSVHGMWRPFMCPMCDSEFCERRALREHLGSVHCVKSSRTAIFAGWQPGSRSPPPDIAHLLQM